MDSVPGYFVAVGVLHLSVTDINSLKPNGWVYGILWTMVTSGERNYIPEGYTFTDYSLPTWTGLGRPGVKS